MYKRKVHYHETDKMGITHHSNYIKWMEEARIQFLEEAGYGYAKLEADGIISPVIGIECQYKTPTTFDDVVTVDVWVQEFKGVKLTIGYEMKKESTGDIVFTGQSAHCFTNAEGRPIVLRKQFPELDKMLKSLIKKENNDNE